MKYIQSPWQSENFYQKAILDLSRKRLIGRDEPMLKESRFFREIKINYDEKSVFGTPKMPSTSLDFIEIDRFGRVHLWEAKKLDSYELTSGRALGQLLFYLWLFKTSSREYLTAQLAKKNVPVHKIASSEWMNKQGCRVSSINFLACGGFGYELAAGLNPVMWNYLTFVKDFLDEREVPPVSLYHVYHDCDNLDLIRICNAWRCSIFRPEEFEQSAFLAFLRSDDNEIYKWNLTSDGGLSFTPLFDFERPKTGINEDVIAKFCGREHYFL